jgi:hypothetical protein
VIFSHVLPATLVRQLADHDPPLTLLDALTTAFAAMIEIVFAEVEEELRSRTEQFAR